MSSCKAVQCNSEVSRTKISQTPQLHDKVQNAFLVKQRHQLL